MSNKLNNDLSQDESLNSIISNEGFSHLNPDLQDKIITSMNNNKSKDGGFLGKLLGIKPLNVAMHIGFLICVILLTIVIVDMVHSYFVNESINIELLKTVFPIVTLSLGYIFGKGTNC